jgi:hypothetical protein
MEHYNVLWIFGHRKIDTVCSIENWIPAGLDSHPLKEIPMPIQVTCPGCMARFSVSDKYAGKKGPCPKCKKEIVVPDKSQEVVIHAPETSGPKNSQGVAVLKPIKRKEFCVGWKTLVGAAVGTIAVIGTAIWIRLSGSPPPTSLLVLGALALAPPIVMLAYTFLRNDELEGYSGKEYLLRTVICSMVFAVTWFLYGAIALYLDNKSLAEVPVAQMAALMAGMIVIGTVASLATLELEIGQAAMHYLTYFAAAFFLCLIMGVELAEPLAKQKATTATPTQPSNRVPPPTMNKRTPPPNAKPANAAIQPSATSSSASTPQKVMPK